jgi:YVTN family beta-propeller protein
MSMRHRAWLSVVASLALACGGSADGGGPSGPSGPGSSAGATHPAGTLGERFAFPIGAPKRLAVAGNGTVYAVMDYERAIERFPLASPGAPMKPIEIDDPFMEDLVINRAGTVGYVASAREIHVLDLVSGTERSRIPITSLAYNLALSPDESRLFVTGQANVQSLPTSSSGAPAMSVRIPTAGTWSVAVSPSGKALYVSGQFYTLRKLDPVTLAIVAENPTLGFSFGDIVVSPDEKELYVVCDNGTLWILDANSLAQIGYVPVGHGSLGLAMTPDGAQLYATSWDGYVAIVDRATRTVVKTIQVGGAAKDVQFDKLGTTAIVANGNGWVDVIK